MRLADCPEWPSIIDVLEMYGPVPPSRGRGWVSILCPFHNETHPSAQYSTSANAFVCFSCGVNGSALSLVQKQEGLKDYAQAAEFCERELGTGRPRVSAKSVVRRSWRESVFAGARDQPGLDIEVPSRLRDYDGNRWS